MLGRKSFTREELDHSRKAIGEQLAAYRTLATAAAGDPAGTAALEDFEPLFFNNLALALDRYFVHRIRAVTGKDGNPLNELELLTEALMNNGGVLKPSTVIKLVPDQSVTKIQFGDRIQLTEDQFERLAEACFADLEAKFVTEG